MANKRGNPQNLKAPGSTKEAQERGRKGGIASGEARRKKRTMKAAAKMLLDMAVSNPQVEEKMLKYGVPEEDITNQMAILVAMVNQATKGNVKAANFLRDTIGESPAERMHKEDSKLRREEFEYQQEKDAGVINEIEDMDDIEEEIYAEEESESNSEET